MNVDEIRLQTNKVFAETDVVLILNLVRAYKAVGSILYCYIDKLGGIRVKVTVYHGGEFISIIGDENTSNLLEFGSYKFSYEKCPHESLFILGECELKS